jgi:halimadienyl-diphosphate synthase
VISAQERSGKPHGTAFRLGSPARPDGVTHSVRPPGERQPGASSRGALLLRAAGELLGGLQSGSMSETAYDTAWVARVLDTGKPGTLAFPAAASWLVRHQHPDGSWGGKVPMVHDRVVSTLAAVLALAELPGAGHPARVARGVAYLAKALPKLDGDCAETVGFELIMPSLLGRARRLGLELPYDQCASIDRLRADKLHRLPPGFVYSGPTSLTSSLEFLGDDLQPELARRCRAPNGSYGASPSATAFALTHQWDEQAADYLRAVLALSAEGGVCSVYPFEVFEKAWVLEHLGPLARQLPARRPHVAALAAAWTPGGVGFTAQGMVPDADDTAIVFKVLRGNGLPVRPQVFTLYEAEEYFCCFPLERNQSVSTNAHVADALKHSADFPGRGRLVRKAVSFLAATRTDGRYWRDKWHVSPYYATGRVIRALVGLGEEAEALCAPAVAWLLETQRANGSWSEHVHDGTCEDTAYALQALTSLSSATPAVRDATRRAADYLWERLDEQDYPELWVGKGLYTPYAVVRAAILGALDSYERISRPGG